ncbi:MAG: hypothetical protein C0183_16285 [Roseiflexus castenholzii]|nr:MAG: hypothetical protein C0183_16285 [Roseiflexus castenholzii]
MRFAGHLEILRTTLPCGAILYVFSPDGIVYAVSGSTVLTARESPTGAADARARSASTVAGAHRRSLNLANQVSKHLV